MKNILITGAKGFVGKSLCRRLDKLNYKYDILDLKDGNDICYFIHNKLYDVIVNLAAVSQIPTSYDDPKKCFETNVYGIYNLLVQNPNCQFINFSTSALMGNSPYSVSKKAGETIIEGIGINLRPCNIFGEEDMPPHVIPSFAHKILNNEIPYIEGNGEQLRDFVYIEDVITQVIYHVEHETKSGNYDVGYGKNISINELYAKISNYYNFKKEPIYIDRRMGDIDENLAKNEMQGDIIGFDEGLKLTLEYYEKNK